MSLPAAAAPRAASAIRILVVDGAAGVPRVVAGGDVAELFAPGDLVVVNDAATLPASILARTAREEPIELRLAGAIDDRRFTAALLGAGDWRTKTEDRPPPPPVTAGDRLFARGLAIRVVRVDGCLAEIELGEPDSPLADVWAALYRAGKPVQYAYAAAPFALWDVNNTCAGRPWAVEMPSAGRVLRVETLQALRRRGVEIARVTHAAGLSSIGDAAADARLPLPERYEVVEETWEAVARTRRRGGRVVAIGTSVVRALEGGARAGRNSGITDFRLGEDTRRAIVDAVLTGVHENGTSHYQLLAAFAPRAVLDGALAAAAAAGLLGHEMGDLCLLWGRKRELQFGA